MQKLFKVVGMVLILGNLSACVSSADFDQSQSNSVGSQELQNQENQAQNLEDNSSESLGQKNARKQAESYLKIMHFSRSSLIEQLEFEGYSLEEATYGVDALNVDWKDQAAGKAQDYLNQMAFSRSGLIEQLVFEGFTQEQAEYGVSVAGY